VQRLGSARVITVDVRLIIATSSDLADEVERGRLRQDLFDRLNGFTIMVPPLRARREDLSLLVSHTLRRLERHPGKTIDPVGPQVMHLLERYDWPGNVQELEDVVQAAITRSNDGQLALPKFLITPA
jgi:transcriptional regulator with GAF, ATPase, and Fis domain